MATSYSFSGGAPVAIKPTTAAKDAFTFLAPPNTPVSEAWVLAQAGINCNGPLVIQLKDEYGQNLSDVAECNSSGPSRIKFTGVKIPSDSFPPQIRVVASNKSTIERSDAHVLQVLLVSSK